MAAAVSKISAAAGPHGDGGASARVVTRFRNTIGLPGRLSVRLQPNHPTDDLAGIAASILDGLLLGAGDAVIGINPATDSPERAHALLAMLEELRLKLDMPTQTCVLAHVTTTLELIGARRAGRSGVPVDRRDAGREQELRHRSRAAGRGAGGGAVACTAAASATT